jgi:hypothetical protein
MQEAWDHRLSIYWETTINTELEVLQSMLSKGSSSFLQHKGIQHCEYQHILQVCFKQSSFSVVQNHMAFRSLRVLRWKVQMKYCKQNSWKKSVHFLWPILHQISRSLVKLPLLYKHTEKKNCLLWHTNTLLGKDLKTNETTAIAMQQLGKHVTVETGCCLPSWRRGVIKKKIGATSSVDPASRRRRWKGKSQIWGSKIRSQEKDCAGKGQQHIQKTDPTSRQRGRPTRTRP